MFNCNKSSVVKIILFHFCLKIIRHTKQRYEILTIARPKFFYFLGFLNSLPLSQPVMFMNVTVAHGNLNLFFIVLRTFLRMLTRHLVQIRAPEVGGQSP